jgi:hypothetical protein
MSSQNSLCAITVSVLSLLDSFKINYLLTLYGRSVRKVYISSVSENNEFTSAVYLTNLSMIPPSAWNKIEVHVQYHFSGRQTMSKTKIKLASKTQRGDTVK